MTSRALESALEQEAADYGSLVSFRHSPEIKM